MTYCSFTTTTTNGVNKTNAQINVYNTQSYNMYIGGICGYAKGECRFDQCYLNGNVYVQQEAFDKNSSETQINEAKSVCGGILGAHDGTNSLTIMNCFVEVSRIYHKFVSNNTKNKINTHTYLGGVLGCAVGQDNVDIQIFNCALVGAIVEDVAVNRGILKVDVGGICGYVNAGIKYSYRDGSINVIAETNSPFSTDTAEVTIAGLSSQSSLDGCFVTSGLIIGTLIVGEESSVTKSNAKLNIVILTLKDEINNCLYDETYLDSTERKLAAYYVYKGADSPFTDKEYKEIRNTAVDNTTLTSFASTQLKSYNLTTINQSNINAVFKTLYLLGFKQYKNVVDITKNPENAWNIVAGYLPRLFWI